MKIFAVIFKIVFFMVLVCVLIFAGAVLSLTMGWPQWIVPVTIVGFILFLLAIYLGKKIYYRRRAKHFLKNQLGTKKDQLLQNRVQNPGLSSLRHAFESGLSTLQRSCLELEGDPLTVLPWYLMLGPSASGKTTMLNQAELVSAVVTSERRQSHSTPTTYCQWRFCRHSVILDTAGRYTLPENMGEDSEQWQELLRLLSVHRRARPLDGVVLVIPADLLLKGHKRALEECAVACRLRLDELSSLADKAPPVFIMISKLDILPGIGDWASLLKPEELGEPLGNLNLLDHSPPFFQAECLTGVISGLKDRRLPLLSRAPYHQQALNLPTEIEAMAPGLEHFFSHLGDNPYQQPLNLRGLFFSSANPSAGSTYNLLQNSVFAQEQQEDTVDPKKVPSQLLSGGGLFLKQFFNYILPRQRWSSRARPQVILRRKRRKVLLLAGWMLILLALLGYSGYSYHHTLLAEQELYASFPSVPDMTGNFIHDSLVLSQMHNDISDLENKLDQVWFNGFWSDQGQNTLKMLQKRFCELYLANVLIPMNQKLNNVSEVNPGDGSADSFIYAYLTNLIWRMELVVSEDREELKNMESKSMKAVIMGFGPDTPDISPELGEMYFSYTTWRPDQHQVKKEYQLLKNRFNDLIQNRGVSWLYKWMLQHNYTSPIRLSEFWDTTLPPEQDRTLSSAYTATGRQQVEKVVATLSLLFADDDIAIDKDEFWNQYHDNYYKAWLDLATNFDQGVQGLVTRNDWLGHAESMNTFDNPYIQFLIRMNNELSAIDDLKPKPDWAKTCDKLANIISGVAHKGRPSPLINQVEGLIRSTAEKTASKVNDTVYDNLDQRLKATDALKNYMEQLTTFIPAVSSPAAGFQAAQSHYNQEKTGDPLPAELAQADVNTLISLLGTEDTNEKVIWSLLEGPLAFLASTVLQQAATQLNEYWQDQVVSLTVHVSPQKLWSTLFEDESGLIPVFISKYTQGFLLRNSSGWHYADWMGLKVPFTPDFFDLINTGWQYGQMTSDSYDVTIVSSPPVISPPTAIKPTLVGLYLQCGEQDQVLENYNYPAEKTFYWELNTCGNTTLIVFFDNFTAQKAWPGEYGFIHFLNDFKSGSVSFIPEDFPEVTTVMKAAGVSGFNVNFQISGAEDAIREADRPVTGVPDVITAPWFQVIPSTINKDFPYDQLREFGGNRP